MSKFKFLLRVGPTLFAVAALAAACTSPDRREPVTLSGKYALAGDELSVEFTDGRCLSTVDRGTPVETPCFMRDDMVYFKAGTDEGQELSRNVWVAYKVHEDRLESSHVEDVDDGQVFYQDFQPKLVLLKK